VSNSLNFHNFAKAIMKRILIIQTAFLGDVILSTALAETLHHAYPDADIHMLVKKENAIVFADHPFLKNIITLDKKKNKYNEIRRLLKVIRALKFDAVINIQRFFSSGFLTAFSGAPIRSGFRKNPFSMFFSHKTDHNIGDLHEINRNLGLISFSGIHKSLMPKLYITDSIKEKVSIYQDTPYICVAPASVWFTKQYPSHLWVEFLNTLPKDLIVYMLGSPQDVLLCNEIQSKTNHENTINLCGKTSISETAALMKDALMNYVNDSGPLHITSAVNAPVTAIFCSTLPSFGFGPLGTDAIIAETNEEMDCRPCGLHGLKACPQGHFKCATSINISLLTNRTLEKL
jgi:lipopolysaccharide heptosyltransferase II